MQRTFVIGDIHGAYTAFMQVMEHASFSKEHDRLICLGDICDRRPQVRECMDELLKIKNLILILGNHDLWSLQWMLGQNNLPEWREQGGLQTIKSYSDGVPEKHIHLLLSAKYYHIEDNLLFVHGGIDPFIPFKEQDPESFLWDRSLLEEALRSDEETKLTEFDEVFIGHTPTISLNRFADSSLADAIPDNLPGKKSTASTIPVSFANINLLDTGAGWKGGKLSMINLHSREVFQSDVLP